MDHDRESGFSKKQNQTLKFANFITDVASFTYDILCHVNGSQFVRCSVVNHALIIHTISGYYILCFLMKIFLKSIGFACQF